MQLDGKTYYNMGGVIRNPGADFRNASDDELNTVYQEMLSDPGRLTRLVEVLSEAAVFLAQYHACLQERSKRRQVSSEQ